MAVWIALGSAFIGIGIIFFAATIARRDNKKKGE
ncbi:hypothetical protein HDC29_001656 [Sphingopyxis sp. JAI108]|jgi:hypothetical protein|nr:hypothetical protein [Sphingopyxis sp. JAI108]